jgi:hypothetical protein
MGENDEVLLEASEVDCGLNAGLKGIILSLDTSLNPLPKSILNYKLIPITNIVNVRPALTKVSLIMNGAKVQLDFHELDEVKEFMRLFNELKKENQVGTLGGDSDGERRRRKHIRH